MSFITITPPQLLTEKQLADQSSIRLLSIMIDECKKQFNLAWKKTTNGQLVNKTVAEAQAFFDQFGDKASMAFILHAKLQELIYMTDNTFVPLVPPYEHVKNQDGTVTILEPQE